MDVTSRRFKELREKVDMKQGTLAETLGFSQSMISNYENGREPSFEVLLAYMKYFDVSADYLLGVTDAKKPASGDIAQYTTITTKMASSNGASRIVTSEDVMALFEAIRSYYKAGAPAGNLPIESLYGFFNAFTGILKACVTGDTIALMDGVNAAGLAMLDVTKILTKYMEKTAETPR